MISHHNTSKLLAGSNQVYFNEIDTIDNWKVISPNLVNNPRYASCSNPTITSLDESPLNGSVIIAGTINGNVWLTKNFDQAWVNVSAGLPIAYISSVKLPIKIQIHFMLRSVVCAVMILIHMYIGLLIMV